MLGVYAILVIFTKVSLSLIRSCQLFRFYFLSVTKLKPCTIQCFQRKRKLYWLYYSVGSFVIHFCIRLEVIEHSDIKCLSFLKLTETLFDLVSILNTT